MMIHGYWHKQKCRCDYCHRPKEQVYIVKDGPTTGKFCGKQHYQLAREKMNETPTNK